MTNYAERLNFSWLISGEIAGSRGPEFPEHLEFIQHQGVGALVRLSDVPGVTPDDVEKAGMMDYHEPVQDMTAPSTSQIEQIVEFIQGCLAKAKPVCVSCDGGYGRTGTLLSCYLVYKGYTATHAIHQVKVKRPGSVLTLEQIKAVEDYALQLGR